MAARHRQGNTRRSLTSVPRVGDSSPATAALGYTPGDHGETGEAPQDAQRNSPGHPVAVRVDRYEGVDRGHARDQQDQKETLHGGDPTSGDSGGRRTHREYIGLSIVILVDE